jgi:hypothetical protein
VRTVFAVGSGAGAKTGADIAGAEAVTAAMGVAVVGTTKCFGAGTKAGSGIDSGTGSRIGSG